MSEIRTLRELIPSGQTMEYVSPKDGLAKAMTIMQFNNYSQLPVLEEDCGIVGALTWKSIACKLTLGDGDSLVKEFMVYKEDVDILPMDMPLTDALVKVLEYEYAFVVDDSQKLCGIVTTADLSKQYIDMTRPFVIVEQIEGDLRKIIDSKLPKETLPGFSKGKKPVNSADDLTFFQYKQILEKTDNWHRLGWSMVDQDYFIKRLEDVRNIRNEIMHFRFEDRDGSKLIILGNMARYLRTSIDIY